MKSIFKSVIYTTEHYIDHEWHSEEGFIFSYKWSYKLGERHINTGKYKDVLETDTDYNALRIDDKFDLGDNNIVKITDKWTDSSGNIIYVIDQATYIIDEEKKTQIESEIERKNNKLKEEKQKRAEERKTKNDTLYKQIIENKKVSFWDKLFTK